MPINYDQPSEFGGKSLPDKGGIMPPVTPKGHVGHVELSAAEQLQLFYRTSQTEDATAPLTPDTMLGLLSIEEQTKIMQDAGLLDKGVVPDA